MTRGLFSIVMTVFGREGLLPYALQSLRWQTYQAFEILLYSDGANIRADKIVESVRKLFGHRLKYSELLPRPGYYGNHLRAKGLEEAQGEFISFLSHDTLYHPDFCKTHAMALLTQPCVSVTKTDYWVHRTGAPDPVYQDVFPLHPPISVEEGGIDAHCFAYPTDLLRKYATFEGHLDNYSADFMLFEQMRNRLPICYAAEDPRTMAAHM